MYNIKLHITGTEITWIRHWFCH